MDEPSLDLWPTEVARRLGIDVGQVFHLMLSTGELEYRRYNLWPFLRVVPESFERLAQRLGRPAA